MNPSAHLTSVQALATFRGDMAAFMDHAKDALATLTLEVRNMLGWLDEQAKLWKAEVRVAEDAVALAKNELSRKKMMRIGDRPPDTTDQEKALRLAKARLAHAEEKLANTRRWQRQLPEEIKDYEGPYRQLQAALETDLPRTLGFLEDKIAALDQYMKGV